MFDRSQRQQIEDTVKKNKSEPILGTVIQVYEHIGPDDSSNFEADVQILDGSTVEQTCPIENSGPDAIDIPEAGDKVVVNYRKGGEKPYVSSTAYSAKDRPPVGTAGTYRRRFDSRSSPAGPGNLYLEANTSYYPNSEGKRSASIDPDNLRSQASVVRIAKREEGVADPNKERSVPAKIEFYDSPYEPDETGEHEDGKSHISVELNYMENQETSSNDPPSNKQTDTTWGMKFDMETGEIKLVDPEGYGIQAHGDGTFTWHIKKGEGNMDFKEHTEGSTPMSL